MNDDTNTSNDEGMLAYLQSKLSRAQMLTAAAAGAAAAAVPGVASAAGRKTISCPPYPAQRVVGNPIENVSIILNTLQTLEYLATTLVNAAVSNASRIGISGLVLQTVQAALAEEVYHVEFLASLGARPLVSDFTVPNPAILTDYTTFFTTLTTLETVCNAAYITATREFAELGQPTYAKLAYQAGAVEAEHRVMARSALALKGVAAAAPPNNKGFETDLFIFVQEAAIVGVDLGFINGPGARLAFPGTGAALKNAGAIAGAVIQKRPNNAVTSVTARSNLIGERP